MTAAKKIIYWVVVLGIAAALFFLAVACKSNPPPDPCQINPTRTNSAGTWVEADGEALDEDPCDADDQHEVEHKKKKPTKKTTRQ